jgi:hypothetical protein
MQIRNSTSIPNETVREIIRHARPPGISNFDVMVKNGEYGLCGRAYHAGSGYHYSRRPFVVLRVGPARRPFRVSPYQYRQHKGRSYWIADRTEALLYIAAHELRHLWQAQAPRGSRRRGMCWGSRGRFSEIDTEAWAIRKLREWRRRGKGLPRIKDCAIAVVKSNPNGQPTHHGRTSDSRLVLADIG